MNAPSLLAEQPKGAAPMPRETPEPPIIGVAEVAASLRQAFARLPEPRAARGRRHPLPAVLTLATLAAMHGADSLYAISLWGRAQALSVVRQFGFPQAQTPAVGTLHYLTRKLDVALVEAALAEWVQDWCATRPLGASLHREFGPMPRPLDYRRGPARSSWIEVVARYAREARVALAGTSPAPHGRDDESA